MYVCMYVYVKILNFYPYSVCIKYVPIHTYIHTFTHSYPYNFITSYIHTYLHTYIPEYSEGEVELNSISEVGQRQVLQVEEEAARGIFLQRLDARDQTAASLTEHLPVSKYVCMYVCKL